ncbi:hypothetical protein L596_029783 [Steinernema carpocapsae]|uniref:Uncharacterized protein n=1 Tax=Steinernema carpocapsae TaxID=34508 RepID=A0A4V5ZX41_STECR|nr:hypothetical protein L596_029783 [Steinernema carpocapsae]
MESRRLEVIRKNRYLVGQDKKCVTNHVRTEKGETWETADKHFERRIIRIIVRSIAGTLNFDGRRLEQDFYGNTHVKEEVAQDTSAAARISKAAFPRCSACAGRS